MAEHAKKPEFTGIQNYPGLVAIVFTVLITVIFVGALYRTATSHSGDHGAAEQIGEGH